MVEAIRKLLTNPNITKDIPMLPKQQPNTSKMGYEKGLFNY